MLGELHLWVTLGKNEGYRNLVTLRNKITTLSFSMLDGEHNLVTRAIRGEAEAFGLLYDGYQPRIYRFILLKVGHREEAEDLTHQVFINAWQHIDRYTQLGFPFSSWLFSIARNLVIDHYRTKKPQESLDDLSVELVAEHDHPSIAIDRKLEVQKIQQVLRTLSDEQQNVILMRFVEDMSQKEIALALGKTEGAVKVMQHRALGQLRKLLAQGTELWTTLSRNLEN